jgi:diguanylate cyclase (GGDEF)-like protein/PAS domain S-box-containing protein
VPAVLYIDEIVEGSPDLHPTIYVGPQVETILGITQQHWKDGDDLWQEIVHPDDWQETSDEYAEYVERGGVLVQEYRVVRPDNGATVWIRDDCRIMTNPSTGERLVFGVMLDISAQKDLEQQLRASESKNRTLIEQIPAVVWIEPLGDNPEPPFVSASVHALFGVDSETWSANDWWERHLHADDRETVLQARRSMVAEAGQLHTEYRMTTASGRVIWVEEVSQVVLHDGLPWILQGLLDDVTQRKRQEQQLEFRAYHDPLTGLANRPLFDESLDQALERARRQGSEVAVLFADIDRFKQVNDQHGHEAGDEVLRIVASRLLNCARGSDVVARRGGDEYLVLLPDIDGSQGAGATERGRGDAVADMMTDRIVQAMRAPIELPSGPLALQLSIGRCIYPWDATDGTGMMAAADAHMYGEKGRPKATDA